MMKIISEEVAILQIPKKLSGENTQEAINFLGLWPVASQYLGIDPQRPKLVQNLRSRFGGLVHLGRISIPRRPRVSHAQWQVQFYKAAGKSGLLKTLKTRQTTPGIETTPVLTRVIVEHMGLPTPKEGAPLGLSSKEVVESRASPKRASSTHESFVGFQVDLQELPYLDKAKH